MLGDIVGYRCRWGRAGYVRSKRLIGLMQVQYLWCCGLVCSDGGCIEWWREAVCACEASKVCVGAVCADNKLGKAGGAAIAKSLEVNATIHTLDLSRTGTPLGMAV